MFGRIKGWRDSEWVIRGIRGIEGQKRRRRMEESGGGREGGSASGRLEGGEGVDILARK